MELAEPQEAARAALAAAPPAEDLGQGVAGEEPGEGTNGGAPPPPPRPEDAVRLELRAVVETFDVLAVLALGPSMRAGEEEKARLVEAWLPYALAEGLTLPPWVPGLVCTATVYGPKLRAKGAAARAARAQREKPREEPRDAEYEPQARGA